MQLKGQQIDALAQRLATEISIAHTEKNKAEFNKTAKIHQRNLAKYKKRALEIEKKISEFNIELSKYYGLVNNLITVPTDSLSLPNNKYEYKFEHYITKVLERNYLNKFNKLSSTIPNREQIKNDIIIETIEAGDLETLINKIKNKYK